MTYNEYVNQPRGLKRKILHKIEDVRFKEAACMKSTATISERTQTSFGNTAEKNLDRYIDAVRELERLMDVYGQCQEEVRALLYKSLPPEEADILEWKYVDGKSPKEISEIIGITYDAARAKTSRADRKFKKVYNSSQMSQHVTNFYVNIVP